MSKRVVSELAKLEASPGLGTSLLSAFQRLHESLSPDRFAFGFALAVSAALRLSNRRRGLLLRRDDPPIYFLVNSSRIYFRHPGVASDGVCGEGMMAGSGFSRDEKHYKIHPGHDPAVTGSPGSRSLVIRDSRVQRIYPG